MHSVRSAETVAPAINGVARCSGACSIAARCHIPQEAERGWSAALMARFAAGSPAMSGEHKSMHEPCLVSRRGAWRGLRQRGQRDVKATSRHPRCRAFSRSQMLFSQAPGRGVSRPQVVGAACRCRYHNDGKKGATFLALCQSYPALTTHPREYAVASLLKSIPSAMDSAFLAFLLSTEPCSISFVRAASSRLSSN